MMKPENGQNGGSFGVDRKAMLRALVEAEVERQKKEEAQNADSDSDSDDKPGHARG